MTTSFSFDINKYMGKWYELMHYPSWFQRNYHYNTTAEYKLQPDGTVSVHNSTIAQGKEFDSYGIARQLSINNFRVDFPIPEVFKLQMSQEFTQPFINSMPGPNYIIDAIWLNKYGEYIFAVVTDPLKQSLYVLSRYPRPSRIAYDQIMSYVISNYDRDRLVQTPHLE